MKEEIYEACLASAIAMGPRLKELSWFGKNHKTKENTIMGDNTQKVKRVNDPRLYIMMRNDLVDLNPGKAMAQAAHAANQFIHSVNAIGPTRQHNPYINEWENQASGFGTTIVLSASKSQIQQIIPLAVSEGYLADFTFDTSYPIKDGADTITVNALTCAYVFVAPYTDDYETEIQLRKLSLHP